MPAIGENSDKRATHIRTTSTISDPFGRTYADHYLLDEHVNEPAYIMFGTWPAFNCVPGGSIPAGNPEWASIETLIDTLYAQTVALAAQRGTVLTPNTITSGKEKTYGSRWLEAGCYTYWLACLWQASSDGVAPVFTALEPVIGTYRWKIHTRLNRLVAHPIAPIYRSLIEKYFTPVSAGPNTPFMSLTHVLSGDDQTDLEIDVSRVDAILTQVDSLLAAMDADADGLALEKALLTTHPEWVSPWMIKSPHVDSKTVYEYIFAGVGYDDPDVSEDSLLYPNRADDGSDILVRYLPEGVPMSYLTGLRTTVIHEAHHRGTSPVSYGMFRLQSGTGEQETIVGMYNRHGTFVSEALNYDVEDGDLSTRWFVHMANALRALDQGTAVSQLTVDPAREHYVAKVPFDNIGENTVAVLADAWGLVPLSQA